jgi:hypothetical protein
VIADAQANGVNPTIGMETSEVTGSPLGVGPVSAKGHPRLWVREGDIGKLRGWAMDPRSTFSRGLKKVADQALSDMDNNSEPFSSRTCSDDSGTYTCEAYAELFAFMSLVEPDEKLRVNFAMRAKTLLMRLLREADKGIDEKDDGNWRALRSRAFSTDDRSRWTGESFALTVDWIYPTLSRDEKAMIRRVFLRWCEENVNSNVTTSDHPEPKGAVNSPLLLQDQKATRYAGNNYFAAHMRNIGLMSLALDEEDDPQGKLRGYLRNATGSWLYMVDHLLRNDGRGGMGPEGYEYGPQTLSYVMQFLLALHTAGEDRVSKWGKQVDLAKNRFWDDAIAAFLHMQSPSSFPHAEMGQVYQPVWSGDGQRYWTPDFVDLFGTLGIHAYLTGQTKRVAAARFIQTEFPPGGQRWDDRLRREDMPRRSILYFLLFEPGAKVEDPRPDMDLTFYSPGLGHLFSRSSWRTDATLFHYNLGWMTIDHQHADGGNFSFFRKGEWLTKRRVGYGDEIAATDSHNGLAIENSRPDHHSDEDYRRPLWKRGSQWIQGLNDGDGKITAREETSEYVYVAGEMTSLYNSTYEQVDDVSHASREVMWLKPDHVVVYDRATSKTNGRFKRFILQVPKVAKVTGNLAVVVTEKRQQLTLSALLPTNAITTSSMSTDVDREAADGEPMKARIVTEVPSRPKDVRFLHVIQGSDGPGDKVQLVRGADAEAWEGALLRGTVILFSHSPKGAKTGEYTAPANVATHIVAGVPANASFDVVLNKEPSTTYVRFSEAKASGKPAGRIFVSSAAGVLRF